MNNEELLAYYFKDNYPIRQMKYRMYHSDNIYYRIPVLAFRFDNLKNTAIYEELRHCLECYEGKLKWTVFESFHGKRVKNYIICPYEVYEMQRNLFEKDMSMSYQKYFSEEKYKVLCENAIKDIPLLYIHIKNIFQPDIQKYFYTDKKTN